MEDSEDGDCAASTTVAVLAGQGVEQRRTKVQERAGEQEAGREDQERKPMHRNGEGEAVENHEDEDEEENEEAEGQGKGKEKEKEGGEEKEDEEDDEEEEEEDGPPTQPTPCSCATSTQLGLAWLTTKPMEVLEAAHGREVQANITPSFCRRHLRQIISLFGLRNSLTTYLLHSQLAELHYDFAEDLGRYRVRQAFFTQD